MLPASGQQMFRPPHSSLTLLLPNRQIGWEDSARKRGPWLTGPCSSTAGNQAPAVGILWGPRPHQLAAQRHIACCYTAALTSSRHSAALLLQLPHTSRHRLSQLHLLLFRQQQAAGIQQPLLLQPSAPAGTGLASCNCCCFGSSRQQASNRPCCCSPQHQQAPT